MSRKIWEIIKTLLWMFGLPIVVACLIVSSGSTVSINDNPLATWQQIPILTWYLFCFECGVVAVLGFFYLVFTGKLFEPD